MSQATVTDPNLVPLTPQRAVVTSRPARLQTVADCSAGGSRFVQVLEHYADRDQKVEGLTQERIARILGLSVRTVRRWGEAAQAAGNVVVEGGGYRGTSLVYRLASAPAELLRRARVMALAHRRKLVRLRQRGLNRLVKKADTDVRPSYPPPMGGEGGEGDLRPPTPPEPPGGGSGEGRARWVELREQWRQDRFRVARGIVA